VTTLVVERPGIDHLGRDCTVRELVASVIRAATAELVTSESALRENGDPEDVHKTRVATRRLRAQLRTLRPVLQRPWVDDVNRELKWLAAVLGRIRDADVLFEALQRQVRTLPEADVAPARALIARLLTAREAANADLLVALQSDRYRALVVRLDAAGDAPPMGAGDGRADAAARSVLPSLVAQPWRGLHKRVRALGGDPSDESLHEVRKRAKKLRYSSETAVPVMGKPAKRLATAAERLQSVLGEVHDAATAETWLRHEILADGGLSVALVGGELIERERRRHQANRKRWPKAWKKAQKKSLRRWLHGGGH
jgi:CHAD domain-containing protein